MNKLEELVETIAVEIEAEFERRDDNITDAAMEVFRRRKLLPLLEAGEELFAHLEQEHSEAENLNDGCPYCVAVRKYRAAKLAALKGDS